MIIKHRDPIQDAVGELGSLLATPGIDTRTAQAITRELASLRRGEKGERECAFHLDGVVKNHPYRVIIHDLRIEHEGEVAQFDHLLINNVMELWILESKSYLNGFRVSDRGEFEYWYDNRYHAMPSPIEQVKRQARILEKVLRDLALAPKRLWFTLHPTIRTAILVDPKTRVIRPKSKVFDTDMVIKADAFFTQYEKAREQVGALERVRKLARRVGKETIIDFASRLASLHRPHRVDYQGKFGIAVETSLPQPAPATSPGPPTPPEPAHDADGITAEPAPTCPKCGGSMARRTAKRGDKVGAAFWGCTSFPRCRGMISDAAAPEQAGGEASAVANPVKGAVDESTANTANPACPRCGEEMVLRTAKRGEQEGQHFWGCPRFPKCRGVVAIAGGPTHAERS